MSKDRYRASQPLAPATVQKSAVFARLGVLAGFGAELIAAALQVEQLICAQAVLLQHLQDAAGLHQLQHALPCNERLSQSHAKLLGIRGAVPATAHAMFCHVHTCRLFRCSTAARRHTE